MDKIYIDANSLLEDAFRLARRIYEAGFYPDLIVGVWRGGTPIAIAVHEYFAWRGIRADHIPIRAISYTGIGERDTTVRLEGLDYIETHTLPDSRILIVDDVFDTGNSLKSVLSALDHPVAGEAPRPIRTACPWYKPANNLTDIVPDYYLHETDAWLVFPHELRGLEEEELRNGKPAIHRLLCQEPPGDQSSAEVMATGDSGRTGSI